MRAPENNTRLIEKLRQVGYSKRAPIGKDSETVPCATTTRRIAITRRIAFLTGMLTACSSPATPASQSDAGMAKDADGGETTWDKYSLWLNGPLLRGANVYQQDQGRDDGASQTGFGPKLALSDLIALRAAGANLVIFSVPGAFHVRTTSPWPAMQTHLAKLVDWAEQADLFVVIAFRTGPGRGEGDITQDGLNDRSVYTNAAQQQAWVTMWNETAMTFAQRRHVVGYDIQVEPHDHTLAQWSTVAQRVIDGIREVDVHTPILVSPGNWGGYDALAGFAPLADPYHRLVYSIHQYEPYVFTHEDTQLSEGAIDSALDNIYSTISEWTNTHTETVAITEFGYDLGRSKTTSLHYLSQQLGEIESRQFSHTIWLWEVAAANYHDFDIRFHPEVLERMKMAWKQNTYYPSNPPPPTQ